MEGKQSPEFLLKAVKGSKIIFGQVETRRENYILDIDYDPDYQGTLCPVHGQIYKVCVEIVDRNANYWERS